MRNSMKFMIIFALLIVVMLLTLFTGTYSLTFGDVWSLVTNSAGDDVRLVFYEFRMPRMLITIICGAALALSGLILQVLSRNPLADPGIIGVNAGSGFGVVLFIMFIGGTGTMNLYSLPLMSFTGGLLTVLIVFFLSFIGGRFNSNIFILIGIATAMGVTGFLYVFTSTFDDSQMTMLNQYLAGNIWDSWEFVIVIVPYITVVSVFVWMKINEMSMLNLEDENLSALGMNVNFEKVVLIICAALLSSVAVSVAGAISFIGLIAPHIARLLFPRDMKLIFLGAVGIGALLLSTADLAGKLLLAPTVIPAGIVVALIGGPYFIYLLMTARKV